MSYYVNIIECPNCKRLIRSPARVRVNCNSCGVKWEVWHCRVLAWDVEFREAIQLCNYLKEGILCR